MITRMDWMGEGIPALGLGTWAIGGPFFAGDDPVGWGETDDAVSPRPSAKAWRLAYACSIRHRPTGRAMRRSFSAARSLNIRRCASPPRSALELTRPPATHGGGTRAATDPGGIDASRRRLGRDRIDLVLLHLNSLPVARAEPVFDVLSTYARRMSLAPSAGARIFLIARRICGPRRLRCYRARAQCFFRSRCTFPGDRGQRAPVDKPLTARDGPPGGPLWDEQPPATRRRARQVSRLDGLLQGRPGERQSLPPIESRSRCADGRWPYACAGRAGLDLGPVGADFAGPRLPYARTGPGPRGRPRERPAQSGPDAGGRAAH